MNSAKFYISILLLLFIMSWAKKTSGQAKPNILWIVSEDNSPFIGAYGDKYATTPNIDRLAEEGILYENAYANAPVCSPNRSTLITGVYATTMGTQNMRSKYPIPDKIRFFPEYLKKVGYYTTNNSKTDYNTSSEKERMNLTWNESSSDATYKNRNPEQPFFAVYNLGTSHESCLFNYSLKKLNHDPDNAPVPPYLPNSQQMKYDWARYYDCIEKMDHRVGELLQELKKEGLKDDTIVIYYSDHGGALGRSKQYLYDSGLHVPLIIRFPEKYKYLAPGSPGTKIGRLVSSVDIAPTILSLAEIPIPNYIQGKAFLGKQKSPPRKYVYSFKGRMDERIDMSRGVRNKKYFYRRNYRPDKIYGQFIQYYFRTSSIRSWKKDYIVGELNNVQSKFWETKPREELYNVADDPHNTYNLANDPQYSEVLERMRNKQQDWALGTKDVGFMPETMIEDLSKNTTAYEFARRDNYPLDEIVQTVDKAILSKDIETIRGGLKSKNPVIRYWMASAFTVLDIDSVPDTIEELLRQLAKKDSEIAVQIAAAESLYHLGKKKFSILILINALKKGNTSATLQAMEVLEIMGDDAKPALSTVKLMLLYGNKNQVYEIRAAALRLIVKLGGCYEWKCLER